MFFSYIKEINKLISKGMSNIYYWEKLTFSRLPFSWKKNWRNALALKKVQGIFGWTFNLALSSSAVFFLQNSVSDYFLIRFALEIKGFYQSSLGNVVDFTDVMNVSPNILAKRWNFKKLRHYFADERAMITTALISSCHWKTLVPFCLR